MTPNTHGGRRDGAGPKCKTPGEKARTRGIRLTDSHFAEFQRRGGVDWLRAQLDAAEGKVKRGNESEGKRGDVMNRELLQQALDALTVAQDYVQEVGCHHPGYGRPTVESVISDRAKTDAAITAIRAELAEAEAEPTEPEHSQDWANMGGSVALSIIDRHADGWSDAGKMMEQWGRARFAPAPTPPASHSP